MYFYWRLHKPFNWREWISKYLAIPQNMSNNTVMHIEVCQMPERNSTKVLMIYQRKRIKNSLIFKEIMIMIPMLLLILQQLLMIDLCRSLKWENNSKLNKRKKLLRKLQKMIWRKLNISKIYQRKRLLKKERKRRTKKNYFRLMSKNMLRSLLHGHQLQDVLQMKFQMTNGHAIIVTKWEDTHMMEPLVSISNQKLLFKLVKLLKLWLRGHQLLDVPQMRFHQTNGHVITAMKWEDITMMGLLV